MGSEIKSFFGPKGPKRKSFLVVVESGIGTFFCGRWSKTGINFWL